MNKQRKRIVPNVVRGGTAIPIGDNLFYMQGRKHEQGGIDIGNDAKTGLEVEGGEVLQTSPNSIRVFSSVPFLYGGSPANLVMSGANPNKVFNAQERFKDINKINDDGSIKQYKNGGLSRSKNYGSSKKFYPSVKSEDFAGRNRSYSIPTKADAIDALRLAGLHGRSDVKAKVYKKYPELRKRKALGGDYLTDIIQDLEDSQRARTAERERRADVLLHTPLFTINRKRQSNIDYSMPTFDNLLGVGENPYFNSNAYDNPFGIDIYKYVGQEIPSAEIRNDRPTTVIEDVNAGNPSTGNVVQSVATPMTKTSKPISTRTSVPTISLPLSDNIEVPEEEIIINDKPIKLTEDNLYVPLMEVPKSKKYNRNVTSTILDSIGSLVDIGGNITSNILNRNMLNDLEYADAPIPLLPTKLKTRININPQLERLYSDLALMENAVNNNTTSSRTALARNQRLRNQVRQASNELYGNKENIETQLINRDRLNQQEVAAKNLRDYNQWRRGKSEFDNQIREALAENNIALTQGIGQSLNTLIQNLQQRNLEAKNLAYLSMSNPYAVDALNSRDFRNLYRMYGGFKCGGKKKVNRR